MPVIFSDRREAGRRLGERLGRLKPALPIVLGIPRGGVPVGYEVSRALGCPLDVIVPRKLPIPWSPEAGFGAIVPDGTRVLNERMVRQLGLSADEIGEIAQEVLAEVRRREKAFRGERPPPEVEGKTAILVDDGLATGYTMIAAVRAVRKRGPAAVIVAVPVSPRPSAEAVGREADELIALHISDEYPFAVASFYREWTEMTDEEVRVYLSWARAA